MSNERHETVTDNVSANHQFREAAKMVHHEEVAVAEMETTTPTCEKSSAVGNTAAISEALKEIRARLVYLYGRTDGTFNPPALKEVYEIADTALSVPPRNCDVLSDTQEALAAIHEDRGYVNNPIDERRLTVEWLFAEAKGETDGSK